MSGHVRELLFSEFGYVIRWKYSSFPFGETLSRAGSQRGRGRAAAPRGDLICCSPGASHLTFKRRNATLPLPLLRHRVDIMFACAPTWLDRTQLYLKHLVLFHIYYSDIGSWNGNITVIRVSTMIQTQLATLNPSQKLIWLPILIINTHVI